MVWVTTLSRNSRSWLTRKSVPGYSCSSDSSSSSVSMSRSLVGSSSTSTLAGRQKRRASSRRFGPPQDTAGEILHHLFLGVALADLLELRDQAARALAFGDLEADPADAIAPRRALDAQGLQAPHPAFVPRAARLDALADPDFLLREDLVELALVHHLGFEFFDLLLLIGAVVARIRAQVSAVELDDPQRDRIEEAPVVRDEQHAAGKGKQRLFQPFDRGEIEMVGRLVEEEQIGCHDERARQRHALLQAAR